MIPRQATPQVRAWRRLKCPFRTSLHVPSCSVLIALVLSTCSAPIIIHRHQCYAWTIIKVARPPARIRSHTSSLQHPLSHICRRPVHGLAQLIRRRHCSTDASLEQCTTALSSPPTMRDLVEAIRHSYEQEETDGVMQLATTSPSIVMDEDLDVDTALVPAVLEAVGEQNKGAVASVLNALLGAYVLLATNRDQDEATARLVARRVDQLMLAFGTLKEEKGIKPDLVSYSLAFVAAGQVTDPYAQGLATHFLEQAQRESKKLAGGKRRKMLASSRRKATSTFTDAEGDLQAFLGKDFAVLLETDSLVVINKPSGVPCFHKRTTTAGKIKRTKGGGNEKHQLSSSSTSDVSLEDALVHCNVPLSTLNPEARGLVHRLDRGASGCMVLAKTDEMHARLVTEFFLRRTTKKYLTLVQGSNVAGKIDEEGSIEQPVDGRPARSKYRVLELLQGAMLLEFEIFTGRKHQIRVHSAEALGCPVWNDPLYGSETPSVVSETDNGSLNKKIFLHASHLSISALGIQVESAALPLWWNETMRTLEKESG